MSDESTILKLRDVRRKAAFWNTTLVGDLQPFADAKEQDLFRRLPTSSSTTTSNRTRLAGAERAINGT